MARIACVPRDERTQGLRVSPSQIAAKNRGESRRVSLAQRGVHELPGVRAPSFTDEGAQRAEARLRGVVPIVADAVISLDEEQRITLYSRGAEEIFGWSAQEAIGKPLDFLLPARFRQKHQKHVRSFAAGDIKDRQMSEGRPEILGLRKNGEEFPAQAAISKIWVGHAWMFTVILRDVTEQRRIEWDQKLLSEVALILASTLDCEETVINIASFVVGELADVCFVDIVADGWARLAVAHRDPSKAAVAHALEHQTLDRRLPHLGSSALETKQPLLMSEVTPEYLESIARSDEHRRLLRELGLKSLMALPLQAHGRLLGALVLGSTTETRYTLADLPLAEEVARRAALAVENARLYRIAQRAIQARDDVVGIVAHDLRNPLATILLQTARLRRSGAEPERRSRRPAEVIERAATRMNRLIQDLLDVTRIEAGRLPIEQARTLAGSVVSDSVEACKALAASASLELRPDVAPEVPEIWADRDRLLQVFENLIGNALKFTAPGGRITVGAAPRRGEVLFHVTDTGAGIAIEDLPHVFDRFWRARKAERHGAGLGLAIVKGIIEAHGSRVWAESTPGCGSTFFFTIPTAPAPH